MIGRRRELAAVDRLLDRAARDEIRKHFKAAAAVSFDRRPANITIHETADPEVTVTEFEYRGTAAGTGGPAAVPCVFVLRIRDGEIVESRDYIDHLARARAQLGGLLDNLAGR